MVSVAFCKTETITISTCGHMSCTSSFQSDTPVMGWCNVSDLTVFLTVKCADQWVRNMDRYHMHLQVSLTESDPDFRKLFIHSIYCTCKIKVSTNQLTELADLSGRGFLLFVLEHCLCNHVIFLTNGFLVWFFPPLCNLEVLRWHLRKWCLGKTRVSVCLGLGRWGERKTWILTMHANSRFV